MARVTPRIRAEGRYVLRAPWDTVIPPGMIFVCEAIRTFPEIEQESIDVYETYYAPYGVSKSNFSSDEREGACVITIISQDGTVVIHVPDTYILYCPTDELVSLDHIALSTSLGFIPGYYDLTGIKSLLASKIEEALGITTTVVENRVPSVGTLSQTDNDIAEAARDTIKIFQKSPEAELREANKKILDLQAKLEEAYDVMRDNGLIVDV